MLDPGGEIALVEIKGADLFLYYYTKDHAFSHQMTDPRARIIQPSEIKVAWRVGSVDPEVAWTLRGQGAFSLASVHYWRRGIEFDYFDVGANVGMTALAQAIFFRRCGWNIRTYAFEPGPVYDLLARAIRTNGLSEVITGVRSALGERAGTAKLYVTPAQSPASSLLEAALSRPGIVSNYAIDVDVRTFDDFARDLPSIRGSLVKIDAEGLDFKVLTGMQKSIAEKLICFQMELYPALTNTYTETAKRLTKIASEHFLIDLGVAPRALIPPDPEAISTFVADVLARVPMPTTDIFAIPRRLPDCTELVLRILEG